MGGFKVGDRVRWYDTARKVEREGTIVKVHPLSSALFVEPDQRGFMPVVFHPSHFKLLTKIAADGDGPVTQT